MGIIRNNQAKPKKGARVSVRQSHAYIYGAHQNRLGNIQSLRGIAALLVVLSHLLTIEQNFSPDSILPNITRFGIMGVDLFFVISGFIMVYVTWRLKPNMKQSLIFLYARTTRIYPLYWFILGILFCAWLLKPTITTFDVERTSLIRSFFLWPDQTLPMLKVAWTLIHELYFYFIFTFILLLPQYFRLIALSLWAFIILAANFIGFNRASPELLLIFHPLSLEFYFGAISAWIFMKLTHRKTIAPLGAFNLIFGVIALMISLLYLSTSLDAKAYPSHWMRCFLFGLPSAFIIYGLAALDSNNSQLPHWSVKLGDWSYSLYLSHVLTLSALGLAWRKVAQNDPVDNIIILSFMILSTVFIAACLYYCVERPALNYSKKIRRHFEGKSLRQKHE